MPTQADVYRVADRLHAAGTRVSLRNVIPNLRYGGSNRVVGPLLRDWMLAPSYRPAMDVGGLPERVQGGLARAVTELWAAAQEAAARALEAERERVAAKDAASEAVLEEALARLDAAHAEIGRLQALVVGLEPGVSPR